MRSEHHSIHRLELFTNMRALNPFLKSYLVKNLLSILNIFLLIQFYILTLFWWVSLIPIASFPIFYIKPITNFLVIYWVFSGLYFPAFGTEKTPYLDTFHAVINCSTWALETSWPLETILGPTHSKFGAVYLIQSPKIGQILWKKTILKVTTPKFLFV